LFTTGFKRLPAGGCEDLAFDFLMGKTFGCGRLFGREKIAEGGK
jgi:hypothetical protein